ncbi:putative acyl- N-acyltransferase [Rosellinia necatrix]|uniref:Putative acyl-N-acyltransferase n=1 Tax=Rosellinia necatrix TaxID=77044 RepID=A0A1W2TUJ6_ROSNE|nr:putative acyl- N-acyltransferase [Rosellinia necatrix]
MAAPPDKDAVIVEVISDAADFPEAFACISEAFGRQVHDAIWTAFNPGWDTAAGRAAGAARLAERWAATAKAHDGGDPHTIFLKATLPDPDPDPDRNPSAGAPSGERRVIAGMAIWVQETAVAGHGNLSVADATASMDLEALYPGDEREQRFLRQVSRSLFRQRLEFIAARAAAAAAADGSPAVMALDLCATRPAFQRRGVASAMVRWGLDEARRRGVPWAATEASSMGRHAYRRLGFEPRGPETVYEVDDEFRDRELPSNLFMVYSTGSE